MLQQNAFQLIQWVVCSAVFCYSFTNILLFGEFVPLEEPSEPLYFMQVVELLIRKLGSESSCHRKVDLFFLVDSITQCSHNQKGSPCYSALYQSFYSDASIICFS